MVFQGLSYEEECLLDIFVIRKSLKGVTIFMRDIKKSLSLKTRTNSSPKHNAILQQAHLTTRNTAQKPSQRKTRTNKTDTQLKIPRM